MPTYSESDFEQIAGAVGVEVAIVRAHQDRFEQAALWHRLDRGMFDKDGRHQKPGTPSARRKKMKAIAASARRILNHVAAKPVMQKRLEASWLRLLHDLGIDDPAAAEDGPGDQKFFSF